MRKLKIGIVILVVIGFPLISWIYLSSGLKWRLTAQEETKVKGTLGSFSLTDQKGEIYTRESITGRFYIVATLKDSLSANTLHKVHEQFAVRSDYRTIALVQAFDSTDADVDARWLDLRCLSGCDGLTSLLFSDGANAAIVDDSLRVRGRYVLSDTEDVRALIRHTAVVLPIDKREKLELKRGANK
jgi:cytochrome oxidase Cu insertion factor (SCO1/SenC/PrrC family)